MCDGEEAGTLDYTVHSMAYLTESMHMLPPNTAPICESGTVAQRPQVEKEHYKQAARYCREDLSLKQHTMME